MTAAAIENTKPGVYDLDADLYHADPLPGGRTGRRRL
jgi:hypothetical protein